MILHIQTKFNAFGIKFCGQLLDYEEQWDLTIFLVTLTLPLCAQAKCSHCFQNTSELGSAWLPQTSWFKSLQNHTHHTHPCFQRHKTSTKWVKNRLGLTGKVIILFPIIPISSFWLLKAHWHQIKSTQKAVVVPEICNVFYSHLLDT